ncbi:MAG: hypothetical protein F4X76_00965 [Chloroflexi bacterium]|nr:hypothetical protein [Chloroflexota bacterium]
MEIVPLLVLMAVCAVAAGSVARWKRRRVWLWALLGALFTIAALIIVAVLPQTRGRAANRGLPDGLDHDSWLRAQAEGKKIGRQRDDARTEAHRDMSGHIPGGGF